MKKLFVLLMVLCASPLWAVDAFNIKEDYQLVEGAKTPAKGSPIIVQEFFSYGCPWCARLESSIGPWRQQLPKNVVFSRVPVVFESGWEWYAKAYYIGLATNTEASLTPKIFKAVHDDHEKLTSSEAMLKFLIASGIDPAVAKSALTQSVAIDTELVQGMNWMKNYKVYSVPAIIVAGRYRADLQLAKGDTDRMLKIVNFLIEKAEKGA